MKILCSNYFLPIYGKQSNLNKIKRDASYRKQGIHSYLKTIHTIGLGIYRYTYFLLNVELVLCHHNKYLKELWFFVYS